MLAEVPCRVFFLPKRALALRVDERPGAGVRADVPHQVPFLPERVPALLVLGLLRTRTAPKVVLCS